MPPTRFPHVAAYQAGWPHADGNSVHPVASEHNSDDDGDDCEPDPEGDDPWDPDLLDDDEPEPEPGDFWFETDHD
ncbi:MAG: hypothetical protein WD063_17665 [Pirellulales bacterium]